MCHGHEHRDPLFPSEFILIDKSRRCKPDICGDAIEQIVKRWEPESLDSIWSEGCPCWVTGSKQLKHALKRLKIGGEYLMSYNVAKDGLGVEYYLKRWAPLEFRVGRLQKFTYTVFRRLK